MRPEAAGMHDALGNALMVEVEELLTEVKIFEGCGAAGTDAERVLIVGDGDALLGGQHGRVAASALVHFASSTGYYTLISILRCIALAGSVLGCGTGDGFLCHSFLLYQNVDGERSTSTVRGGRTIPALLSLWSIRPGTPYTCCLRAQTMPGQRAKSPPISPGVPTLRWGVLSLVDDPFVSF
jgi:hypothetical protein